jgi:hypothetical protein
MSAAVGLLVLLSANPLGFNTGAIAVTTPNPAQLTSFEWLDIESPQRAGDSFGVTIYAKDENGDNFDYDGNAFLSTSPGSYVYPKVVQFNNGICDTSVVVTLSESLSLRCSTGTPSGESNMFEVLAGSPKRLIAILPGEQLAPGVPGGRVGLTDSHVAGDTFSFQVYLTDEWFNTVGGRDDSVYFSSTDGFAQLPSGGELSNGTGSFTAGLRTAGQRRIFTMPAPGESLHTDTSSAVNVAAGPFTQMLLVAPGEMPMPGDTASSTWQTPGKSGTPDPQYLRAPFSVTVYPCDRCWNRVAGPGDTLFLRSDFPFEFLPAEIELRDSAVFDPVQFNTPGPNQNIWAADQASGDESYATRLDIRAHGATLEITAPDTVRSGETTQVLVRVLDANGDPVVATLVRSSVVKGSGTMLEPALLSDTLGFTTAHFLCTPSPASEQDSIRVSSGDADTVFGIYISHLSDSLFAFPNPFGSINRDRTLISYYLQRSTSITLTIYDPFGNEVWSRHFSQGEPGAQSGDNVVYWDGRNSKGRRVASGIYVIQLLGTLHTGIESRSTYRVGVVW